MMGEAGDAAAGGETVPGGMPGVGEGVAGGGAAVGGGEVPSGEAAGVSLENGAGKVQERRIRMSIVSPAAKKVLLNLKR